MMLLLWIVSLHTAAAFFGDGPTFPGIGSEAAPLLTGNASTAINGQPFPSLLDASLEDLITGLDSGLFTSVDLVDAYIARIAEVNAELHAVTELNPAARAAAQVLDDERAAGTVRSPLHGVPILIKDNIATDPDLDGGMNTTAGSYALLGAQTPGDSTVVARLRNAGAVILGKSNLSQWANFRSYNSSNGWSAYGGQTNGAYYPSQDPSGSSSGSGVAASLGLSLAALGTETSGSILSPSERNNIVGIKPTVGLTSRYLVVPISEHQDTVGPMARSVKDAAYILAAIAGPDPQDNYTLAFPFPEVPDYVGACKDTSLLGKRLGIPRNLMRRASEAQRSVVITAFDDALSVLRDAGATIIDDLTLPGADLLDDYSITFVLEGDFVSNLESYFAKLVLNPNNITGMHSMSHFTHEVAPGLEVWPLRDTGYWDDTLADSVLAEGGNLTPEFWGNFTQNLYLAGHMGITGALKNHSLDALVLPTDFAIKLPAIIGSPVITVPLGKYPSDQAVEANGFGDLVARGPNFPFGISFMGDMFSEEDLIGMAYAFERMTAVREAVEPYLKPKAELVDIVTGRTQDIDEIEEGMI